jgi:hypothetical protein
VNHHDPPTIKYEIDDRAQAFARVAKLVRDGRVLSGRRKRIAADGDYSGPCLSHLCVGPMSAPSESYAIPKALRSAAASAARMRL